MADTFPVYSPIAAFRAASVRRPLKTGAMGGVLNERVNERRNLQARPAGSAQLAGDSAL
jgi:hypothetical protein